MPENTDYQVLFNGDAHIWINEGGAISLKVISSYGDPAELSEEEALELARILVNLVAKIRG